MVPSSGIVMFMIIRIVVVLPAPLGPSRPYTTPFGTCKREVLHRDVPGEALGDAVDCDDVRFGHGISSRARVWPKAAAASGPLAVTIVPSSTTGSST